MAEDFELFKEWFKYYQEKFGLNNYTVYFFHKPLSGKWATINIDHLSKVATATLNSKVMADDKPFKDIKRTAKHEAIHLLLGRLSWIAESRYVGEEDIREEEESLVVRLESLINVE